MDLLQVSLESCVVLCCSNTADASDLGTQTPLKDTTCL